MKKLLLFIGLLSSLILSGCGGNGYDGVYAHAPYSGIETGREIVLEGTKVKLTENGEIVGEFNFASVNIEESDEDKTVTFISEKRGEDNLELYFDSETSFLFRGTAFKKIKDI